MTKTNRERWETVAVPRIDKLEAAAINLSKCANARTYEFTEDEADAMMTRVEACTDQIAEAFGFETGSAAAPAETPQEAPAAPSGGADTFPHDRGLLASLRNAVDEADLTEADYDGINHLLAMLEANVDVGKRPNGSVVQAEDNGAEA